MSLDVNFHLHNILCMKIQCFNKFVCRHNSCINVCAKTAKRAELTNQLLSQFSNQYVGI